MKRKVLGIVIGVVVVTAAVVLGLFAAGVFGKKDGAVANAASATVAESGYFANLGKDAYFDVREDRDPSTAIDNFVRVNDSKGNKVPMKSTRLENGLYRLTARDGFVERASYRIWLYVGVFVAEQYAPYDTFIFTIAGKGETEEVLLKDGVEAIAIEETTIEAVQVGTEYFFNLTFATPAEARYQEGQIVLAKKPARCFLGDEFDSIYTDTANRNPYSDFAAYYVLRESEVKDGREEVYCRLAKMNEVFEKVDIYKSVPITQDNLTIDEEALAEQIANSSFGQAVLEAAEKTLDLYSAEFPVRAEKPKMVVSVFADAVFPDPDTSGLQNALPAVPTLDDLKSAIPNAEKLMNDFLSKLSGNLSVDAFLSKLPNMTVEDFFNNLPESVNVDSFIADLSKTLSVDSFIANLPDMSVEDYISKLPKSSVEALISEFSNLSLTDFMSNLPNINVDEYFSKLPIESVQSFISNLSELNVTDFLSSLPNMKVEDYLSKLPTASVQNILSDLLKGVSVEDFFSEFSNTLTLESFMSNLPDVNVQDFFSNLPDNVDLKDFFPDLPLNVNVEEYISKLPTKSVEEYFSSLSNSKMQEIISNLTENVNVESYLSGLVGNLNVESFMSNLPSIDAKSFFSNLPTSSVEGYLAAVGMNVSVDSFISDLPSVNVSDYLSSISNANIEKMVSSLSKTLSVENFVSDFSKNINLQNFISTLPNVSVQDFFANLPTSVNVKDFLPDLPTNVNVKDYIATLPNVNVKDYFSEMTNAKMQSVVTLFSKSVNLENYISSLSQGVSVQDFIANLPSVNVESFMSSLPTMQVQELIAGLSQSLSVENFKALLPKDLNVQDYLSKLPNGNVEELIAGLSQYLNVDTYKALLPNVDVEEYLSKLPTADVKSLINNLSSSLKVEDFIELLPKDLAVEEYFSNLSKLSVQDFMSLLPTVEDLKSGVNDLVDKYAQGERGGNMQYAAELILNIKFTITVAKGVDIVFSLNNRVHLDPYLNFEYSYDLKSLSFNYELNFGTNVKTETVCSVEMELPKGKMEATSVEDFKEKFTALLNDKTTEKAICANEVKLWNIEYWIYCFTLNLEVGFDFDFEIKAQMNFEYHYNTQMSAGITLIDGDFTTYKSFDSQQEAKDFALFGKATIKGGLYLKFMGTLLSVAGVGFKIKFGAYGEIGGQLRIDMEAALQKKQLHIMKGYYVTAGMYLALDFSVKAGIDLPYVGFLGYKNNFELLELRYPFFEAGSKYLIKSFVNQENNVEIQGSSAKFDNVLVNAFKIDEIKDVDKISVPLDSFDIEYIGDAAKYITLRDGGVYVSPSVGKEFTARVKLTAKSDSYVVGYVNFHKAAVMPTCEVTEAKFDKKSASDITFDTLLNKSEFVSLTGQDITPAYYQISSTGAVTISKGFLNTLPMGDHKFYYNTSKGNIVLTITVMDSTPISAEKTTATFNKSAKANVAFKLNLHGNAITSVDGLQKGEYTVDKSGTFVIYAIALFDRVPSEYDFTVNASNGTSVTLTVTVKDDRAPILYENTLTFAKTAALRNAVPVRFEKYGYDVKSVEGNNIATGDYTVSSDAIMIGANYLAGLAAGTYNFSVRFRMNEKEVSKPFSITVKDNAQIVAYTAYAEFDKNDPADAEFTVVSTGGVVLTGSGVTAANYTFSGKTLKIKKAFLATLDLGEYQFSASNNIESVGLTVTVVNTATPEIVSEDVKPDGTLLMTFDKAKPKAISFELFLTDQSAFSVVDLKYTLEKTDKGTYKFTVAAETLSKLSNGDHEFELLTGTNSLFLTVRVGNSAKPSPTTQTSLSYVKGSNAALSYNFANPQAKINNIEVKGEGVTADTREISIELYNYIVNYEEQIGTFTIDSHYSECLPAGYYKVLVTFANEEGKDEYVINLGITVSESVN